MRIEREREREFKERKTKMGLTKKLLYLDLF